MSSVSQLLGDEAKNLLEHKCMVSKDLLHLPGPDFIERVMVHTDRSANVLRNMQTVFSHGRLAGTGYLSILPVDQGIEHSAGSAFAPNPMRRFLSAEDAELVEKGAASFHRQLIKGDLASEYDNEIRLWMEELKELD